MWTGGKPSGLVHRNFYSVFMWNDRRGKRCPGHASAANSPLLASSLASASFQLGQATTIPRGSSPSGAEHAPQPCIRSIRKNRNHDAVMRISGKAPARRVQSAQRLGSHGFYVGSPSPRIVIGSPGKGRQVGYLLSFPYVVAYDAGRKTMPSDTSPVAARRQSAMSSFRANATIIVLRVLPRPSAVRA